MRFLSTQAAHKRGAVIVKEANPQDQHSQTSDPYHQTSDPHRNFSYTNLWKACFQRDPTRAQILAEECGTDINRITEKEIYGPQNTRAEKGLSPLHWLAMKGYNDLIQILYDTGVLEVSKQGRKHNTPLHWAIRHGNTSTAKLLIQCGATINEQNKKGNTPLHCAVMQGFKDCAVLLCQEGAQVNISNSASDTALHWAARRGDEDIVMHLLEMEDIMFDSQNNTGETPLHCAVKRNSLGSVSLLIKAGVNGNIEDNSGNIPLHIAIESNDISLVALLYDHEFVDVNKSNHNGDRCLHIALRNGSYDLMKWLLEQPKTNVDASDCVGDSVLHLAVKRDHLEIIKKLVVDCKADMSVEDSYGRLPIHVALLQGDTDVVQLFIRQMDAECAADRGREEAAKTPLQTKLWHTFLNYKYNQDEHGLKTTPLRIMIKQMPDVAELIFNRCIGKDKLSNIFLDYEFLDDTFAKWETKPYTDDFNILKCNHPMKILQRYNRKKLLDHPLLRMLLKRKWQAASVIYFVFLAFYAFFVSFLSAYMMTSIPPYINITNTTECDQNLQSHFEVFASYLIFVLAGIGMASEIAQMILTKWKYLEFHNILDWVSYTSAILVCIKFNSCGLHTNWQWQLGCFSVFVSWMNLLFFLRRLPRLGIYVVMITLILKTFFQFFIILFLFVLAFAITFHLLLQNQYSFQLLSFSVTKAWVMMFGELEYFNMFHAHEKANIYQNQVPYEEFTLLLFVCFLILVSLIVMNLLVGLAVSDVEKLQKNSVYAMMGMQIDLALDVELSLPSWLHKRIHAYQNDDCDYSSKECSSGTTSWWTRIQHFFQGPLYGPWVLRDAKEIVRKRQRPHGEQKYWIAGATTERKIQEDMKLIRGQMKEMQAMLKQIAENRL